MKIVVFFLLILLNINTSNADSNKTDESSAIHVGDFGHSPYEEYLNSSEKINQRDLEVLKTEIEVSEKIKRAEEKLRRMLNETGESKTSNNSKKIIKEKYPKKGTIEYKTRMDCLMSDKKAEECDKEFKIKKS